MTSEVYDVRGLTRARAKAAPQPVMKQFEACEDPEVDGRLIVVMLAWGKGRRNGT